MKHTILILRDGKIYGPFPDQETATTWNTGQAQPKLAAEMYSFWETAPATVETAHECGTRLVALDEATARTPRKATGA